VNVEYLAAGLIVRLIRRVPAVPLLALVTTFDLVDRSIFVFYFSQRDLTSSVRYLSLVPLTHSLKLVAVLLVMPVALSWVALRIAPPSRIGNRAWEAVFLATVLVLVSITDVAAGTNGIFRLTDTRMSVNIASSPALSVVRAMYVSNTRKPTGITVAPGSASSLLLSSLKDPAPSFSSKPHVVLVVVESYGQLLDAAAASALAAPYSRAELKSRYRMETGVVPFQGGTVSGELRELCGVTGDASTVPVPDNASSACLPILLSKRGYRSTAIHGYVGEMFGRNAWYPKLGFTESLFLRDLNKHPKLHDCDGFFAGACDSDVARFIQSILVAHRDHPQFVYWLTLNSHLPVPPSINVGQDLDCSANGISDRDVCVWAQLIFNVNDAIAKIASDPAIGPTEFIVVGDHGPPFWRATRRSLFSQTNVPYFHLVPRSVASSQHTQ